LLLASLILGIINLVRVVLKGIFESPVLLVESDTLFPSFGLFRIIVIGLELLKSIKSYLLCGAIDSAFVIGVAIIAPGNKLTTFDTTHVTPDVLVGIGIILMGLSALSFVLKTAL
jgi:uncharacterized membrane protein (DUF373 family)